MKKNKAYRDILYIAISFFILVTLWIGFNLYHAHATSTVTSQLEEQTNPIDPTFNTTVIQQIKARTKVTPAYELNNASESATTPTPQVSQAPLTTSTPVISSSSGIPERLGQ